MAFLAVYTNILTFAWSERMSVGVRHLLTSH